MARRMYLNFTKLSLFIVLGTVVYNEYLSYLLASAAWPHIPSSACSALFIADPQIQGNTQEPPGIIGTIQRWDSDRYLSKVYSWISSKYSNATSIFLGDLLDEGSIAASSAEFNAYTSRFFSIFPREATKWSIYTPGDNDIGGEGQDPVTLAKVTRFNDNFNTVKPVVSACDWLDIVPVSRLTEHGSLNITSKIEHLTKRKLVAVISHLPVLPLDGRFAERIMADINPDIIFSAHDHRGYLYTGKRGSLKMSDRNVHMFSRQNDITPIKIQTRYSGIDGSMEMSEMMSEIVVPTCSYRMGVNEMGVGLAVFNKEGELVYHNLWLPSRFPQLFTYLASFVSVVILTLIGRILQSRRLTRRRSGSQSPHRNKDYIL